MESQTSQSSISSGTSTMSRMNMKDISSGFESTLLKDFQSKMAASGSCDSLFSTSSFFSLSPNKRSLQYVDDETHKEDNSAAVSPNAITSFLQGQLESIQAKRRKCEDGQARSAAVDDSLLTKQMEPVGTGASSKPIAESLQASRARRVSDYSWSNLTLDSISRFEATNYRSHSSNANQSLLQQQQIQEPSQAAPPAPMPVCPAPEAEALVSVPVSGETAFYLHNVCRHFATQKEIVEIALTMDPEAIRRKVEPVKTPKSKSGSIHIGRMRQEQYAFPLNIALQNGASTDVLELLISSGKDVLLQKDGREQTGSLAIALTHKPCDLDLIELLMFANLPCLMVTDRKLNYPLHVACSKGASLAVLECLYLHYPAALFHKNFNGETPLDIARRTSAMDEQALNFIFEKYNQGCVLVAQNTSRNVPGRLTNMNNTRAI